MKLAYSLGLLALRVLSKPSPNNFEYDEYGCVVDGVEPRPEMNRNPVIPSNSEEVWNCEDPIVEEVAPVNPCLEDPCREGCGQPCDRCAHLNLAKCQPEEEVWNCEDDGEEPAPVIGQDNGSRVHVYQTAPPPTARPRTARPYYHRTERPVTPRRTEPYRHRTAPPRTERRRTAPPTQAPYYHRTEAATTRRATTRRATTRRVYTRPATTRRVTTRRATTRRVTTRAPTTRRVTTRRATTRRATTRRATTRRATTRRATTRRATTRRATTKRATRRPFGFGRRNKPTTAAPVGDYDYGTTDPNYDYGTTTDDGMGAYGR